MPRAIEWRAWRRFIAHLTSCTVKGTLRYTISAICGPSRATIFSGVGAVSILRISIEIIESDKRIGMRGRAQETDRHCAKGAMRR